VPPRAYWGIARAKIRRFTLADRHDGFARVLRALASFSREAGLDRARDWRQKQRFDQNRFLRLGGWVRPRTGKPILLSSLFIMPGRPVVTRTAPKGKWCVCAQLPPEAPKTERSLY